MNRWIFPLFFAILVKLTAADAMLKPLPKHLPVDREKAALGKALFFDPILSGDDTVSCATCHILPDGGDDNLPVSFGIRGKRGNINAPTVLNALFNFRQFWDGRAKDLREQAEGPVENPVEMGNSFENLVQTLKKSPYKERFAKIYPEKGITKFTITDAIAEYEKSLITPSRFDRYLRGDKSALTPGEKKGLRLFREKGCILCHHGVNLGGTMYSKFGVYASSGSENLGRYNVTHDPLDKYYFKVPTLRNIEKTAPYFHDARTSSLKEAVAMMAKIQLGRSMTDEELDDIVAFLKSLTGELPPGALP
ncbi:cytochrome-c peroxidase [Hydrogenimonas sp. SS33]|uniref:cytochrome-c peroxidase n=1 Tax=Hydrogenimonas leucolamina TaxID=2954236 RepID=UPI00336C202C